MSQAIAMTTEPIFRALPFLLGRQLADGSWQEDRSVAEVAAPWVRPDDLGAMLYLTANCGYWVSRLLGDQPAVVQAVRFLLEHAVDGGRMPAFSHGHWLAAGPRHRAGDNQAAERALEHLETAPASLPSSYLGWLIVALHFSGLQRD